MSCTPDENTLFASRIATDILAEPLVGFTPLVGKGSVNKVFIIETVNQKVVIRLSCRAEAFDEYTKEAWSIERATERGVPTSSVMALGRYEGHSYIVLSFIEGDEGRFSASAKPYLWQELGKCAKLIHSIRTPGFGLSLSEIMQGNARISWLRHLDFNIESLTKDDALIRLKVLTLPQSKAIRRVFASLREREFVFGLNHGDISLKNTIVNAGKVSLLDWGSAEAAVVPHHDLIQMLKMNMLEGEPSEEDILAFLKGYGISPAEYEQMIPELEGLLALRAFDKLRWALEKSPADVDRFADHAREALSRCLARN